MKCYFHGSNLETEKLRRGKGIISFTIPDYGVVFRSQHYGNTYECEYAAALALIRFLQLNHSHFKGKKVRLLTDSAVVVYQVNRRISTTPRLRRFRDLMLFYKRKLGFAIEWVPSSMNRAEMAVEYTATNSKTPDFNYDIFDDGSGRKSPPPRRDQTTRLA